MTQSHLTPGVIKPVSVDWKGLLGTGATVLSWLCLNRSVLHWFGQGLQEISRFNCILLGVVALFLGMLGIRARSDLKLSASPVFHSVPLGLMLGSGMSAIAVRWLLNLEQLPAVLFILGTYGLVGLFLNPAVWRKGLVLAIAIACLLPFGIQSSLNLGFPARMLTAEIVEQILTTWNITALSSEDIIVLDTGIAHVDLPCSGLKSLWTGSLFLVAATGLEGRQLGWRWLLVCAANIVALMVANIGRVLILVVITHVFQQPALAELLHVPLGVVSFVAVCLLAWGLLRAVPRSSHLQTNLLPRLPKIPTTGLTQTALVVCTLGLMWFPQPTKMLVPLPNFASLNWSIPVQTQPIELEPVEQNFFTNYPGVVAQKRKFEFQGMTGTILLVASPTWQAHHAPELCLVSSGFQVNHMEKQQLTPTVLGRWLTLEGGTRSATYWFQSPHQTTDDFLARIGSEILRQEQSWTLSSIVFDRAYRPNDSRVQSFLTEVHRAVDRIISIS